jgi:N-acetylmuramoyl-L-alanine amidase
MNQDRFVRNLAFIIMILVIASCAHNPYSKTNRKYKKQTKVLSKTIRQYPLSSIESDSVNQPPYFIGTTNFNLRKPNFVIIHHTAQNSCEQTLQMFTTVKSQVSAHYVICKDGTIHHILNDYLRAWQAGVSKWGNLTDINSYSCLKFYRSCRYSSRQESRSQRLFSMGTTGDSGFWTLVR